MPQKSKLFSKTFVVLFFAMFVSSYCLYCLNSTVPVFVQDVIGGSAKASGVLNTCFTVCACIARLVGGHCADRFGRRRIILAGGSLLALGTLAYNYVSAFPLLMLFRGIQGIGFAVMSVGSSTALIDVLPKDRLGEGLGISALSSTLAGSIGPSVSLAIFTDFDFRTLFFSTAAVSLCGVLAVLLFGNYEKKLPPAENAPSAKAQRGGSLIWQVLEKQAIPPAAIYTLFITGFSITYVFMTLYAVSTGIPNPGSYFIASSVCQVFARVLAGKFADRDNVLPVVAVGGILGTLSYLGLFFFSGSAVYILCGALFGISGGLIAPVMNRLAVADAAPHRRGAASATYYISTDIGNGLGGILWGALIDLLPYSVCFGIAGLWTLLSLLAALVYLLRRGRCRAA